MEHSFSIPLDWGFSDNRKFVGKYNKIPSKTYDDMKKTIYWKMFESKMIFHKTKVFVSFVVYKSTMRGDAHNFTKGICDGLKLYTTSFGLDDNWYCVCSDWHIEKENPRIEITVRQ